MNADQELELLSHVQHLAESVDTLGLVLCILLGVVVALLLTSRR